MKQGWSVADEQITFVKAPAAGVLIEVFERTGTGNQGATDIWAFGAWSTEYGHPTEVEFYADRLVWAASVQDPQTFWLTVIGDYSSFDRSVPTADDDAISATLNSRQLNRISDLVPLRNLLLLTSGAEWRTLTGQDEPLTPSTISVSTMSLNGSLGVPALLVDDTALYVSRGSRVRDLAYTDASDAYAGGDLTLLADHLIERLAIVDWCYQQVPDSVVWAAREDGALLSLTYARDQGMVAWARHPMDGKVESLCCIPEGAHDVVYAVVHRRGERIICRLALRAEMETVADSYFMDFGLSYDGRNQAEPLTAVGGPEVGVRNQVYTLTAESPTFAVTDINDWIVHQGVRLEVTEFVDAKTVKVIQLDPGVQSLGPNQPPFIGWSWARNSIAGLEHLAGETVSALGDGASQHDLTVDEAGVVTLQTPATIVHVGLRMRALIETLEVNTTGSDAVAGTQKRLNSVAVHARTAYGFKVGTTIDRMEEFEPRSTEPFGAPAGPIDGPLIMRPASTWEDRGRLLIVQDEPLPCEILAVTPDVAVGR